MHAHLFVRSLLVASVRQGHNSKTAKGGHVRYTSVGRQSKSSMPCEDCRNRAISRTSLGRIRCAQLYLFPVRVIAQDLIDLAKMALPDMSPDKDAMPSTVEGRKHWFR